MTGLVISKNANLFVVEDENGNILSLKARGKVKDQGIYVGDKVEFCEAIDKVFERKNLLIRPPICNVDRIFIVLSSVPAPDLLLVDKMILCSFVLGIQPIIVVNKEDVLDKSFVDNIKKTYKKVTKVLICSAKTNNIENLKKEVKGICAFAGQSAVGKSSLINALFGDKLAEIGDISKKVERGKQTTRLVRLYKLNKGYIADTAGFSSLVVSMLVDLKEQEVARYYPDFLPYLSQCKYRTCLHTKSKDCAIVKHVESGEIAKIRYDNYLKIIDEIKLTKRF